MSRKKTGFDAPLVSIEDDCFDHAQTARNIHSLIVGTPPDWSVRIGVYSPWGTGKSTVLQFVEAMLDEEQAAWVWFNPWQFGTKDEMYVAFIATLHKTLAESFGYKLPTDFKWRKWYTKSKDYLSIAISAWNKNAGNLAGQGLSFLNQFIGISLNDVDAVQKTLKGKRVVVFIDDLDRVDPHVIPELLFAMKELMDIPGFSFVCAFDPVVVGKVLGEHHPGFGNGLDFLDKIIDYPVWLPIPTGTQLLKMAEKDIGKYANFVPTEYFHHAIPLLPQNPRSIRQFVRLLAMLKVQIKRHNPTELNWPIILSSNVIKVRFPKEAPSVLSPRFWDVICQETIGERENRGEKTRKLINEQIDAICASGDTEHKNQLAKAAEQLAGLVDNHFLLPKYAEYQFRIADGPAAVTWKEFDTFFKRWCADKNKKTLEKWVDKHASKVCRNTDDVISELFEATINKRQKTISTGIAVYEAEAAQLQLEKTDSYIELLDVMTTELSSATWFSDVQFLMITKALDQYVHFNLDKINLRLRKQEKEFFRNLIDRLSGDYLPYLQVLDTMCQDVFKTETREFFEPAKQSVEDKVSLQIIQKLGEVDFIRELKADNKNSYLVKKLLFDPKSPAWTTHKKTAIAKLEETNSNPNIQHNAVDLFSWIGRETISAESFPRYLVENVDVMKAWFNALVSTELAIRVVGGVREGVDWVDKDRSLFTYPEWWDTALKMLGFDSAKAAD